MDQMEFQRNVILEEYVYNNSDQKPTDNNQKDNSVVTKKGAI